MQIPITSGSLIVVNKHPGMGLALSPEMDAVEHGIQDCIETAGTGDGESHLVQVFDPAHMDWRDAKAILGSRFGRAGDEPWISSSQPEALPKLLDFNIDIEGILADPGSLQQGRPKCKVLKFERPPHMKVAPSPHLFNASNATRTAARVIEFRRPEHSNTKRPVEDAL